MGPRRVPARALFVTFLGIVAGLPMMMRRRFMVRSRFMVRQPAQSADLRHVPAISAHRFAASSARFCVTFGVAEPAAAVIVVLIAAPLSPVVVVVPAALCSAASPPTLGICHCLSFRTQSLCSRIELPPRSG